MAKKNSRRSSRRDFGAAFLPDPSNGDSIPPESDSTWLAAEMIAGATSGEFVGEDARNELSIDEVGGPYVSEAALVYDTDEAPS